MASASKLVRPLVFAVVALAGPAAWSAPAAAQDTESPLSPAGRLRLELAPSMMMWDSRFRIVREQGSTVSRSEPLGIDFRDPDGYALFPGVEGLPAALRDLTGDPNLAVPLGTSRAEVSAERIRLPFRVDLGVFEWLTLGVTVPLEKNRTEVSHLFRADASALGITPAIGRMGEVSAFLDDVGRAVSELEAAGGSPELEAELEAFLSGLTELYRTASLFPASGTEAGAALDDRLSVLNTALQDAGVGAVGPSLPLAAEPVTGAGGVEDLLTGPGFVYRAGPQSLPGVWSLGDVELHAVVGLLGRTGRDSAQAPARFRWEVGIGGLARLATGNTSDPDLLLDLGSGDGQMDLEGRVFANLTVGSLGLWADGRYGTQRSTTLPRRVAPPDRILVPLAARRVVEWSPGSYMRLELAPRLHLTPELALIAGYRYLSKDPDSYAEVGGAPEDPAAFSGYTGPVWEASSLGAETARTTHEVGGGMIFSTLESWRDGRTTLPFEIRFSVRTTVSGDGGQTPDALTAQVGLRVYRRLWGG